MYISKGSTKFLKLKNFKRNFLNSKTFLKNGLEKMWKASTTATALAFLFPEICTI